MHDRRTNNWISAVYLNLLCFTNWETFKRQTGRISKIFSCGWKMLDPSSGDHGQEPRDQSLLARMYGVTLPPLWFIAELGIVGICKLVYMEEGEYRFSLNVLHYTALWHIMSNSLTRCSGLASCVLEEAGVSFHPSLLVSVSEKKWQARSGWWVRIGREQAKFVSNCKKNKLYIKISICWTADSTSQIFIKLRFVIFNYQILRSNQVWRKVCTTARSKN